MQDLNKLTLIHKAMSSLVPLEQRYEAVRELNKRQIVPMDKYWKQMFYYCFKGWE